MAAEVDVLRIAGYGEVTPEWTNGRNGYRSRQLDTSVGSIDLAIPKLRAPRQLRGGTRRCSRGPPLARRSRAQDQQRSLRPTPYCRERRLDGAYLLTFS
jgi:Transposase, Mutator family